MCPACAIQLAIKGYLNHHPLNLHSFWSQATLIITTTSHLKCVCLGMVFIVIVSIQAKLSPLAIV